MIKAPRCCFIIDKHGRSLFADDVDFHYNNLHKKALGIVATSEEWSAFWTNSVSVAELHDQIMFHSSNRALIAYDNREHELNEAREYLTYVYLMRSSPIYEILQSFQG